MGQVERIKIEYYFEKQGTSCVSRSEEDIWIDVGNSIDVGIFDHHTTGSTYDGTAQLIISRIDLLRDTVKGITRDKVITIHMHNCPDFDAIISAYLVCEYINNGEDYFVDKYDSEKGKYRGLVDYATRIDAGKDKCVTKMTLYALMYWMYELPIGQENVHLWGVNKGFEWINLAKKELDKKEDLDLACHELPPPEDSETYNAIKNLCSDIERKYKEDVDNNILEKDVKLKVYRKDGGVETVSAYIWHRPPLSEAEYILAREQGAVLTFVPHEDDNKKGVRVSINLDKVLHGTYTLKALAEIYEQKEQIYENEQFKHNGELIRDYSTRRERNNKNSRFAEAPFGHTSDPWFFSEKEDMIDSPGNRGSQLSWDEMREILYNYTSLIKKSFIVEYTTGDAGTYKVLKSTTNLLEWKKECREKLSDKNSEFKLLIVEISTAMIAHSYNVLEAYYAALTGSTLIDNRNSIVAHIDYRTHLFCNVHNAILFVAVEDNDSDKALIDGLVNATDASTIHDCNFVKVIDKLVRQRKELRELSEFLAKFKGSKDRVINKRRKLLIEQRATAQKDDIASTQIEQEIYDCVKECFGIVSLRESATETMNTVSEYSKEKAYGNLNFLSMITIPFIITSTLFQMGFLRFSPAIETGDGVYISWVVIFALIFVVTILLFIKRKK